MPAAVDGVQNHTARAPAGNPSDLVIHEQDITEVEVVRIVHWFEDALVLCGRRWYWRRRCLSNTRRRDAEQQCHHREGRRAAHIQATEHRNLCLCGTRTSDA